MLIAVFGLIILGLLGLVGWDSWRAYHPGTVAAVAPPAPVVVPQPPPVDLSDELRKELDQLRKERDEARDGRENDRREFETRRGNDKAETQKQIDALKADMQRQLDATVSPNGHHRFGKQAITEKTAGRYLCDFRTGESVKEGPRNARQEPTGFYLTTVAGKHSAGEQVPQDFLGNCKARPDIPAFAGKQS